MTTFYNKLTSFFDNKNMEYEINIIDRNIDLDKLIDETYIKIKSFMNTILNTLLIKKSKDYWLDVIDKLNNNTNIYFNSLLFSNLLQNKPVNILELYWKISPYRKIFPNNTDIRIKILSFLFDRSNILLYYKNKFRDDKLEKIVELIDYTYYNPIRLYMYIDKRIDICILTDDEGIERYKKLNIKYKTEEENNLIRLFIHYNPIDLERIRITKLLDVKNIINILDLTNILSPKNIYHEMLKNYQEELYEMIKNDNILYIESFIDTMMDHPEEHDKLYNYLNKHKSCLDYQLYGNKIYYTMALLIIEQPLITGRELNEFEKQKILKYLDKAEDYADAKTLKKRLFFEYLGINMDSIPDFELNNDIDTMCKIAKFFMKK